MNTVTLVWLLFALNPNPDLTRPINAYTTASLCEKKATQLKKQGWEAFCQPAIVYER